MYLKSTEQMLNRRFYVKHGDTVYAYTVYVMSESLQGPIVLLVLSLSLFLTSSFLMEVLKIGSFNINGTGDQAKRGMLMEYVKTKMLM